MKQVLQSLKNGDTEIVDTPCPAVKPGHVLIQTRVSLISAGTERMVVEFGKASLLNKARQQPDKVRAVFDKVKTDGLIPTVEAVRSQLNQQLPMGYCNVGTLIEVGDDVTGLHVGDRVVSNGQHAEVVCVPKNLCAAIPESVSDDDAVFTVLGAIALEGIRLVAPTLGETVAVMGLGLVGLLTVQLLRAQGCRVIGMDFNGERLELARRFGTETVDLSQVDDPVPAAVSFSRGRGVDGVLITASTSSNKPIQQAAAMCRQRGRIVLVGVTGMQMSRADFYAKELTFQVSCSYGPGRYDPCYEEHGNDYPLGFVRWTEQRNFEAVLDMLADGRIVAKPLVSHRFGLEHAGTAYSAITETTNSLGVLIDYPCEVESSATGIRQRTIHLHSDDVDITDVGAMTGRPRRPSVGFIGAGNFATRVLIPAFQRAGANLEVVASAAGLSALHAARRFGFAMASTDPQRVLTNPDVDTVVIATRHDTHAYYICQALEAGKHVFVEKPLALNDAELNRVVTAYAAATRKRGSLKLMVGFNRRFAPQVERILSSLEGMDDPKAMTMTVNAGAVPAEHWVHDSQVGGGRIIGEACHFIDLLRCLCGHAIVNVDATRLEQSNRWSRAADTAAHDSMTITLQFADGSIGTVHYLANGHRAISKERLEIFCAGRTIQLDNFRKLHAHGWPRFRKMNLWQQDKGHNAEVAAFVKSVVGGSPSPIGFDELVEVTRASFVAVTAAETRSQSLDLLGRLQRFDQTNSTNVTNSHLQARSA